MGPARSVSDTIDVHPDLARRVAHPSNTAPPRGFTGRPARAWDRLGLRLMHRALADPAMRLALWDGTARGPDEAEARYSLTIHDRATLVRLIVDRDLAIGDSYTSGRLTVAGDLVGAIRRQFDMRPYGETWVDRVRQALRRSNTLGRARDHIHHHYDIGNDFYRLWLDRDLVYTCAYFPRPDAALEEAQTAKLDLVCRKLRLRPGEEVIEAGCGWGALARHMAAHYGVKVRAFNISSEQIAYARRRAEEDGLSDRVTFVEDDYRNIAGRCDAFVSVGMLEHVGLDQYAALARVIDRTLAPERGRGLLHFIGRNQPAPLHPWIERRIFPGAYPPTLAEVSTRILEPLNLSVSDIENLRLHYALTLRHWLDRFEEAADRVAAMFDEPFVRAWRLYLAGSVAAFDAGTMQLFQIVFARAADNDLPWTRAYLYDSDSESGSL